MPVQQHQTVETVPDGNVTDQLYHERTTCKQFSD